MTVGENTPHCLVNYGTNPRWSPDGKHIAFIHDNTIMLFSKNTDKIKQLAKAGKAKALCFYPDGKSIIYTNNKNLRRVDISNGKVTPLLTGDSFYEVDMAVKGNGLATTVKTITGYKNRYLTCKTVLSVQSQEVVRRVFLLMETWLR